MLEVPVYNTNGERLGLMKIDEAVFGGTVNAPLLKQAVVAYHANRHQCSARTRGRSEVEGSTRKVYRQKGTGNARRGAIRTNIMRGGGVAFAKQPIKRRKSIPKRMRKAALNSAILAKILGGDLMILDGLEMPEPKTAKMAEILENLKINRSCLLALDKRDRNVYLSCRNLGDVAVRVVDELNAYDVATRQKMLMTSDAIKIMTGSGADEE